MFRLRKPDERYLEQVRERYLYAPLSYAKVGCLRGTGPAGYNVDNYRVRLGSGLAVFERARQAIREWRMLRLGWIEPCWSAESVKEGALVGTMAQVFGLWAVNVCRIVYVVEEEARYGFAYGTLTGHAECGEERFVVEWDRADDSVWYDIQAVSKPGRFLTRLGYPWVRHLQRRFGRDSLRAMAKTVSLDEMVAGGFPAARI